MKLVLRHAAFLSLLVIFGWDTFFLPNLALGVGNDEKNDIARIRLLCSELEDELVSLGFENVLVFPDSSSSIVLSYENRLFRSEMTALCNTFRVLSTKMSDEGLRIAIIIKRLDYPIIAFQVASEDLQNFLAGAMSHHDFYQRMRFLQPSQLFHAINLAANRDLGNSSFHKVDLEVKPIFDSNLGNREDPFKFKASLDIGVSSALARGARVSTGIRIPVMDDINKLDKESVRLYSAIFNYILPLGRTSFFNNNVGYFSGERYGFSSQFVRYLNHGNVGLSARLDLTGFLLYEDKKWFYSNLNLWTYDLAAYWQFSKYGFRASISYSRFLLGDKGIRISLGRYMRESRLDFFAIATDGDQSGGIDFRLPLFPQKRFKPRALRINIPNMYSVRYDYLATEFGKTFEINNNMSEFRSDLTGNYILNHLEELRACMGKR